MMKVLGRVALIFCVVALAGSCSSKKVSPPPSPPPGQPAPPPAPPPKYLQLSYANPKEDPRCTCNESRAVSLVNTDRTSVRYGKIRVQQYNVDTNALIQTLEYGRVVDPRQNSFVDCTLQSPPMCKFRNVFTIIDEAIVLPTVELGPKFDGMGPLLVNDAQACMSMCANGHIKCHRLEGQTTPLIAPFIPLLDAANEKPGTVITKQAALKAYGLELKEDACQRGDIVVGATTIENVGSSEGDLQNGCVFNYNKHANFKPLPNNMITRLAPKVTYTKARSPMVNGAGVIANVDLIATDVNDATSFEHEGDGTVEGNRKAGELNALYGGDVRRITRFGDEVIITTTNGCVQGIVKPR